MTAATIGLAPVVETASNKTVATAVLRRLGISPSCCPLWSC